VKSLEFDRRVGLTCLLLAVASLLLHARAIGFDFVDFDDTTVLLSHPNLYNENSLGSSLFEIFVGYMPREEPLLLRDLSWALDARLFGFANPVGYHLGNVVLNALNVCLLFLFLYAATRRYRFALVVAAIFAALPIHVEPVSWVMGRKDVLSAFFVLLALLAQSAELESQRSQRRRLFYMLGLLFTAMALLSKMGAVALVPVLALHRVFLPDLDGSRPANQALDLRETLRTTLPKLIPHALLSGGIVVWYGRIISQHGVIGWRGLGPTDPEHIGNVALFTPLIIGRYLGQTFWTSQPSLYYRWPNVEIPLTRLEMLTSVSIAAAVAAAVLYCLRRRRDLAFYLLSFLAFLVPYLNIIYVGIWSADRYVYLSSFCLVAIAVSVLLERYDRAQRPLRAVLLALMLGFALNAVVYTLQHQGVWRDTETLWQYEAYRDEPSLLSIQALAQLHMKRAGAESDPALRASLMARSRREIARGFEQEKALGRVSAPYATSEQLQLARLHYLLGRLDMLEQAPVARQIEHFRASHALAPTRGNTLMLAGAYFDLGKRSTDLEQEQFLHRSLDYFLEYMEYSALDRLLHEESLVLLAQNYEQRFPFLQDRIHQARETMTQ
jgi:hypothetical protein